MDVDNSNSISYPTCGCSAVLVLACGPGLDVVVTSVTSIRHAKLLSAREYDRRRLIRFVFHPGVKLLTFGTLPAEKPPPPPLLVLPSKDVSVAQVNRKSYGAAGNAISIIDNFSFFSDCPRPNVSFPPPFATFPLV